MLELLIDAILSPKHKAAGLRLRLDENLELWQGHFISKRWDIFAVTFKEIHDAADSLTP